MIYKIYSWTGCKIEEATVDSSGKPIIEIPEDKFFETIQTLSKKYDLMFVERDGESFIYFDTKRRMFRTR